MGFDYSLSVWYQGKGMNRPAQRPGIASLPPPLPLSFCQMPDGICRDKYFV